MVEAPEARRSSVTTTGEPTNTLIITKVPPALLHHAVTPSLKEFFERFGKIEAWVPLTTFERVVVVYREDGAAERAKEGMDHTLVEGFGSLDGAQDPNSSSILRVYRGKATPLDVFRGRRFQQHLPVPATDKNFLISPPGSPPVGWEQIREDPPNMDTLADDLARALEGLTVERSAWSDDEDAGEDIETEPTQPASPARQSIPTSPRDTLIIPHRRTESGDLPSVLVSDTDVHEGQQATSTNGLTISQAFSIQRGSPGSISQVKATVDSMQGSLEFPQTTPRIDRTPRPPISS